MTHLGSGASNGELTTALANFFGGGSQIEDISRDRLTSQLGDRDGESDPAGPPENFEISAKGPFGEIAEAELVTEIIDSIGNPNRNLGWLKTLSVTETESEIQLSLQRNLNSENVAIASQIDITGATGINIHLVDGFNNALQALKTQNDSPRLTTAGEVYLVDGINNSLRVSDIDAQGFASLGRNSSSLSFAENQPFDPGISDRNNFLTSGFNPAAISANPNGFLDFLSPELLDDFLAETPRKDINIDGEFLYFLANYASGNRPPAIL